MSSQGSVMARVYVSDAYLPLRDVPVIFTQGNKLLAVLLTDSSGLTAPLRVETPDTSESLAPNAGAQPYSLINIRVDHPGYEAVTSENVQVFPGVETVQAFQLRPLPVSEQGESIVLPGSSQNL